MRETILTSRLILRDVTEADADLLLELDRDPEVMRYIGSRPPPDRDQHLHRIRTVYLPGQSHPWHGIRIVVDRAHGTFWGWVFIRPADRSQYADPLGWTRPDEVEIGYRYVRSAWGRGIATEAARPLLELALDDPTTAAVVACASASNTRSLRVLEKLGLQRVGEVTLPDAAELVVKLARVK